MGSPSRNPNAHYERGHTRRKAIVAVMIEFFSREERWPTQREIAAKVGISLTATGHHLKLLEQMGNVSGGDAGSPRTVINPDVQLDTKCKPHKIIGINALKARVRELEAQGTALQERADRNERLIRVARRFVKAVPTMTYGQCVSEARQVQQMIGATCK